MPGHYISSYLSIKATNVRKRRPINQARDEGRSVMSEVPTGWYVIRLKGHLDPRWAAWFDGLDLTNESDGTAVIQGPVADQAALHGLLHKLRDVGIPLISLTEIDPDHPEVPTAEPRETVNPQRRPR